MTKEYTKREAEEYFGCPVKLTHDFFDMEDYGEESYTILYWTRTRKDTYANFDSVKADMDEIVETIQSMLELTS